MTTSITESGKTSFRSLISVVVCTYNRANLLVDALQSLCEQSIERSEYEVVIVDNNSTDKTSEVVDEFCHRFANVRYCFEPKPGLSHARNRGYREAKGEFVAYTDDDCRIPEKWLAVAKEIIERISPGVFGGPYFPYYRVPKAYWFKDSYGSNYQGDKARILKEGEYLSGGNIFFRRTLLETLGGFDAGLGMSGQEIAYGEETALLRRIRVTMPDQLIYYDPRLYVLHLVQGKKMRIRWTMRQRFVDGRYSYRVFLSDDHPAVGRLRLARRAALTLMELTADLARGVLQRDSKRYPYVQNYLYERALRHLRTLGMLYELYRRVSHNDIRSNFEKGH
jgi:glycosyltransferase involved in cell wall biosynthesis